MLAPHDTDEDIGSLSASFAGDIVEIVVFTTDELFLQTLREAVGGARRLWHVPSADKIGDLLLAGQVGILVLDVQNQTDGAPSFIARIKDQFPDLVVVVAGSREAESSLTRLISAGVVYRFIHKPMSPARARLFADAAVKRYAEQRARLPRPGLPKSPGASLRLPPPQVQRAAALGLIGVVGALGIGLWWGHRSQPPPVAATPPPSAALPAPVNPAPREPLSERDRLLSGAENALLAGHPEEAAAAIEAARRGGVESGRIAFLRQQLAGLRAAHAVQPPRAAPKAPDAAPAAPSGGADRLEHALGLVAESLKDGHLIEPADDNAKFYLLQALAIDPGASTAQAARATVARDLLAATHAAVDQREFARAAQLLDAADGIASASDIDNARQLLTAAQHEAETTADGLLARARARLGEDRLIAPANDSAAYYLASLAATDPANQGLAEARQELASRLIAKARLAIQRSQTDEARGWLEAAAAAGPASADLTAAGAELAAALEHQRRMLNPVDASTLTLVKSVNPVYPPKAELNHTEGWVELDFTVTEAGTVRDIAVHAASPSAVFDSAAIGALSHWRYQPVLSAERPVAQRARIRIRFTLTG